MYNYDDRRCLCYTVVVSLCTSGFSHVQPNLLLLLVLTAFLQIPPMIILYCLQHNVLAICFFLKLQSLFAEFPRSTCQPRNSCIRPGSNSESCFEPGVLVSFRTSCPAFPLEPTSGISWIRTYVMRFVCPLSIHNENFWCLLFSLPFKLSNSCKLTFFFLPVNMFYLPKGIQPYLPNSYAVFFVIAILCDMVEPARPRHSTFLLSSSCLVI